MTNYVEKATLVIRMREGTTYSTQSVRVSFRLGIPYLAFSWPTGKIDGEIIIPMRDVESVYCAWTGTEDQKWNAVSQAFKDGVMPQATL